MEYSHFVPCDPCHASLAPPCRVFPCLAPRRAEFPSGSSPAFRLFGLLIRTVFGCQRPTVSPTATLHVSGQPTRILPGSHGYDNRCLPIHWGKRWHFPLLLSQLSSEVERKQTSSDRCCAFSSNKGSDSAPVILVIHARRVRISASKRRTFSPHNPQLTCLGYK